MRDESLAREAWALHKAGMAMSEISAELRMPETDVHAVIVSAWRNGNNPSF